jgi:hypothetical protein
MILGLKNFKGNYVQDGLDLTKWTLFSPNGIVRLLTIDDSKTPLLVNGHQLCLYQHPISKEDFKATCV